MVAELLFFKSGRGSWADNDEPFEEDVALSKDLEAAIEAKMVQQQKTEKALFKQQQAKTDVSLTESAVLPAKSIQGVLRAPL